MQSLGIFAIVLAVFFVFSFLAIKSVSKLNPRFNRFYDFSAFFPKAGRWSVLFYLLILTVIISLVLYLGRGEIAAFFPA